MEANELRIGNYVMNNVGKNIDTVDCISPSDGGTLICVGYYPPGIINFFKPVPITKEKILEAGFKHYNNSYSIFIDNNQKLVLINHGDNLYSCSITHHDNFILFKHIEYLHELQNLYFVLKKEELTFKLN